MTLGDELHFKAPQSDLHRISQGKAGEWITAQYVALKMLEESGEIKSTKNGFLMPASVATRLDEASQELLALPPKWQGCIFADIKGKTNQPNFTLDLSVENAQSKPTYSYQIKGPLICFSSEKQYLLTPYQLAIFDAEKNHKASEKTEYDNLLFLHTLQKAKQASCDIRLAHFDKLNIVAPDAITIDAEFDPRGNLFLTPNMGQSASTAAVQKVLGQLNSNEAITLKVGDEIVLFSPEKLAAVKEVITNRVVLKDNVNAFLRNPTAYIDASLVDLDLGFSCRVHGATAFKHAYFGETDGSTISWFGNADGAKKASSVFPINQILTDIQDEATFSLFSKKLSDAQKTSATLLEFEDKSYDISDPTLVSKMLEKLDSKIKSRQGYVDQEDEDESKDDIKPEEQESSDVYVVDIDLNDEELNQTTLLLNQRLDEVCWQEKLDWQQHKRTPFPHQNTGVRWILGLLNKEDENGPLPGALLADDMGLGKTFMALSAISHFYRQCEDANKIKKPTLIVAPLSLLENWKDEVSETFHSSPFDDIVILQSSADLNRFRQGGVETRGQLAQGDEKITPRYSLKVGKHFGTERLDLPERLVITTYQTLRDYQFSLCLIDWGVVVFDEAQNIKNPNALQTRAAKGLKAEFKLVTTGTPVENSLADFWCLFDTAYPGFLGSYQDFRNEFITPILGAAGDELDEVREKIGLVLRLKVGALMLRRVKEDNLEGLPNKFYYSGEQFENWQYLPHLSSVMKGYQKGVYDSIIQKQQASTENYHVLTAIGQLRDASLHPRLVEEGRLSLPKNKKEQILLFEESSKLQSVIKTLNGIEKKKQKCIIFAVNKRLQAFLSVALGQIYKLGPLSVINGDTKAVSLNKTSQTRKSLIQAFEAKEGFNIIIMSPVAAGVGLTLVGANHVIHFERHWNPAKEAQATDRVYRIGQKQDVHIYVPLSLHPEVESFDINLHRLLTKKTLLKEAVVTPEEVIPSPEGAAFFYQEMQITQENIDKLSWQQFEALSVELLAKVYKANSAWLTQQGSDFGADGVILGTENMLIQAKYTQGRYKGYKGVQEIHAAKPIYEKALDKPFSTLIFITNSVQLSAKTKEVAESCQVMIIGRKALLDLLNKHPIYYQDLLKRLEKEKLTVS